MGLFAVLAEVILIGHSLVGPHIPGMVEQAFRDRGVEARVDAQVINGAPLRYNWDNPTESEGVSARAALASGAYDIVVMTEAVPIAQQVEWNDTAGYVSRYNDLALAANPDVQTWLYEVWPPFAGDDAAWRAAIAADLPVWEGVLADANAGRPDGAAPMRLIPGGQALSLLNEKIAAGQVPGLGKMSDLLSDEIHPNGRGLYFISLVIHAAITGETPVGLPRRLTRQWSSRAEVLTDDQARVLQEIAWQAVSGYHPPESDAAPDQRGAGAPVDPAVKASENDMNIAAQSIVKKQVNADAISVPSTFEGVSNPALGIGLAAVNDWSVQQPFLDIMKTARPWIGHLPGQWGGWGEAELAAGGFLDPDGWPLAIPPDLSAIATLILTDLPPEASLTAGRYILTHEGEGTLTVGGRARNVTREPGQIQFDFTPGEGSVLITLAATSAGNPVRNIRVVKETDLGALQAGALFNPDWIARIRGVRMVRFMDWMETNGSGQSTFSSRPRPGDYSWARAGVPLEVMVALANELKADPWFTLPHRADDDYMRRFAEYARDHLAPGLRAHVEYSNEVWNWQFEQARWAEEQALALWGEKNGWVQFYGMRASQMATIWAEAFGAEADRLVRVLATQTGWKGLEDQILKAPRWLAADRSAKAPAAAFDAYAVTGYFSGLLGAQEKQALIHGWLSESLAAAQRDADARGLHGDARAGYLARHRFDLAVQYAIAEITDGAITGNTGGTLHELLTDILPYQARVAEAHGLQLVMYEGGTHVVGNGPVVDDAELTAFFTHLNYTDEMAELYARLLAGWAGLTQAPFNAFVDVYRPNKWGSWGALRHLSDDNPRWLALARGQ